MLLFFSVDMYLIAVIVVLIRLQLFVVSEFYTNTVFEIPQKKSLDDVLRSQDDFLLQNAISKLNHFLHVRHYKPGNSSKRNYPAVKENLLGIFFLFFTHIRCNLALLTCDLRL